MYKVLTRKNGTLDNYFVPPHGDRPPSDEAVRAATQRYIDRSRQDKASVRPARTRTEAKR